METLGAFYGSEREEERETFDYEMDVGRPNNKKPVRLLSPRATRFGGAPVT